MGTIIRLIRARRTRKAYIAAILANVMAHAAFDIDHRV